jgi:hypothetical protein
MPSLPPLSFQAVYSCRSWAYLNFATPGLTNCKPALLRIPTIVRTTLHRNASTMSSAPVDSEGYIGQSGRHYNIERVLQGETFPFRRVYFATQVNLRKPRFDLPA